MGLMECSRKGCDNILCNRHSNEPGLGYICDDCYNELYKGTINALLTMDTILKFIDTPKNTTPKTNFSYINKNILESVFQSTS